MSEKTPLQNGLGKRDAVRRTRIDLGDRRDMLLAKIKRQRGWKLSRDESESVLVRRGFRYRDRCSK